MHGVAVEDAVGLAGVAVGHDVTAAQVVEHDRKRLLRLADVHHQRQTRLLGEVHGLLQQRPPLVSDHVLGQPDLEPAHHVRVLGRHLQRIVDDQRVGVEQLAEPEVDQPEHGHVQEVHDAHVVALDDELAEGRERRRAGGPGVGRGHDTASQMGLGGRRPDLRDVLEDVGVPLDEAR